jgi:calcineurin-like phosphoesterase family protein
MIEAWWAMVKPEDVVLHLGDLAQAYPPELPGKIILVRGNHDKDWKTIETYPVVTFVTADDRVVVCRHDPHAFTLHDQASWYLHGHSHGLGPKRDRYVDVSIDAEHSLYPIPASRFDQKGGGSDP